jgi:transcriptional repressor NrdR
VNAARVTHRMPPNYYARARPVESGPLGRFHVRKLWRNHQVALRELNVNCPFCAANNDKVIDSRESDGGKIIRRRRECLECERRFTTYERVEQSARLMVVKRDGSHVAFNRDNIMRGVQAACGKRAIPEERKELLVSQIEDELHQEFDREVASSVIGERVMSKLRDLDSVAYIRYASEHHQFKSVDDLRAELDSLDQSARNVPDQQPLFGVTDPKKK